MWDYTATLHFYLICLLAPVTLCINHHSDELMTAINQHKVRVIPAETAIHKPIRQLKKYASRLDVYCYAGDLKPRLSIIWKTVTLRLSIDNDYALYRGDNASDVWQQYVDAGSRWLPRLPWQTDTVSMQLCRMSCVGVDTRFGYEVNLQVKGLDVLYLMVTLFGILFFLFADKLSRNVLLYYATGMSVGILASLLVIVFIVSRFIPKRYGGMAMLIGGWSLSLYALQQIANHARDIVTSYTHYVGVYVAIAAIISFAVCYRRGPPTDPRGLDLIRWAIQSVAIFLVYFGVQVRVAAVTVVIATIIARCLPIGLISRAHTAWRVRFPPRIRLLTLDEYTAQASAETQKALGELRKFCQSPDCDKWRTVSRLKSPQRFANFVEGSAHLTDDEVSIYDNDPLPRVPVDFSDVSDDNVSFS